MVFVKARRALLPSWRCIAAIVLTLVGGAQPGQLITIKAGCSWTPAPGQRDAHASTSNIVVVRSPLYTSRPVYLTNGWWIRLGADGKPGVQWTDKTANGMLVRAFVHTEDGVAQVDGIQLADGRVFVDGRIFHRSYGALF